MRETKKTRIDGVHEERAGRRDVVKASCLASWRGAHRPSEAPPSSPLGVRSLWPCAVRTLPQGWRVHNGGTAHAPCPSAGGCLARCHESVGGCIRRSTLREGRATMDDEQHQPESEESRGESALLKLQEEFHHFIHECLDCRREIASHWQFCAHCGTRLATHCPGCGNPLPPPGAHACPRCGVALPPVQP